MQNCMSLSTNGPVDTIGIFSSLFWERMVLYFNTKKPHTKFDSFYPRIVWTKSVGSEDFKSRQCFFIMTQLSLLDKITPFEFVSRSDELLLNLILLFASNTYHLPCCVKHISHEAVKQPYRRRPTSRHVNFCCKISTIPEAARQPQGCCKADSRWSHEIPSWHLGWTCNSTTRRRSYTTAARSLFRCLTVPVRQK